MHQAKTKEKRPGPISIATPRRLLIAPCNSPCSDALTRCVIIPWAAGPESAHMLMTVTPIMKRKLLVAQPINAIPTAPRNWPT
jgi:hypothetical protein